MRRNPDDQIRDLLRLAAIGDPRAKLALERAIERLGHPIDGYDGWEELDDAHRYIVENGLQPELAELEFYKDLRLAKRMFVDEWDDVENAIAVHVRAEPDDFLGRYWRVWFRWPS